ncbi:tetratricopeptide repeat protein [Paraburkholderia sp. FT54]|uniref:tetratricopeptide repeat protein n=1 Tax=Paraburkholderia sp. FT54 TaxID=3074437 RepID=UPI002877D66F|nr:tetratricopeptide repeat protein [Paraburkholderia sp. FT54]WNC88546.1 tetratricopeptide repeat protein [Paraburkholderia sp. FT54]
MSNPTARNFCITDLNALIARADADYSAQRMTDAAHGYRQVLAISPRDVHSLHRMGLVSVNLNETTEASAFLELALQAAPARADLWEHAGLVATMRGEYVRAEAFYRHALGLAGRTATLHRNLGDCLRLSGRLSDAKAQYKQAISIEPDLHHAIRAVARISTELGEDDEAADYWLRAWGLDPSSLQDGLDLITALEKVRRTTLVGEAVAQIRNREAASVESLQELCLTLYKMDRFAEMLSVSRQGLDIDPRRVRLHHYAAHALSVRGRVAEAIVHSRKAVRLTPDDPVMQCQLACLELSLGDFKNGWARRNTIYATPLARSTLVFPGFPLWNGEPVAGRQFLLVGEQGRGDEIQFIRFAEWLYQQGATVDVMVSQPIARIATSMKGVRSVFTEIPSGPYDYWSHMLRMPEYMNLDLTVLPIAMPYLAAPPREVDRWRVKIDAASPLVAVKKTPRIGVVWSGGPYTALDRFRSICIEALIPLFSHPGTTWFSVQKGEHERDSEALEERFDFHTLGPVIGDFADTLAILETLDLLITVDTAAAHLAGAANLPVWVLLPAYSELRWLTDRTDSPWYPSMRLFRQRELGEWDPVIEEVRDALRDWCGTRTP